MRIQQLNLLRYGKFTDRVLDMPVAPRDFHFVVGANEAGKSTTRSAILDLLYGIETRSTFDFVHAKADMRLRATLQHAGLVLEFVRLKARIKTLQTPAGDALAETALAPFLGGTDRSFFDQMFGLDHTRLQAGGNAILSAHDDVGQILFQSAAGIASLGTVRDQLAQEAESLWARRRANDRAYYVASDDLARAEVALKAATVRTRDWVDAQERVQTLDARRQALAQQVHALEAERLQLERVRRVAPALAQWRQHQAALAPVAQAVLLPEHAAAQLADTELALAAAGRDHALLAGQARALADQLAAQQAALQVDEAVLRHQADIQALAERRLQVLHHEQDIERRQLELAAHAQHVQALLRQLAWPEDSQGLPAKPLPGLPARAALADLARQHAVLQQADQAAAAMLADKVAECQALHLELGTGTAPPVLPVATLPASLRAALAEARALGDAPAMLARDQAQVARAQRDLAAATAALGAWAADIDALRRQMLPPPQDLARRLQALADAHAACQALVDKHADLASAVAAQALLVAQVRNAHHPVTWSELLAARGERNALWSAIKAGTQAVQAVAAQLDQTIATADHLADQRHDKAQAASELQAQQDALDRLQQQADDAAARRAAREAERSALKAEWAATARAAGVEGLPLPDAPAWCAARAEALRAAGLLAEAQHTLQANQLRVQTSTQALRSALADAGQAVPAQAAWPALLLLASDTVDAATATQARLQELHKQHALASLALARLQDQAQAAHAALQAWQVAWRSAAMAAGLPADTGVAAAEGALAVMTSIDLKLREMQEIRHARIDTMQRDLRDFAQDVGDVLAHVSAQGGQLAEPALAALPAGDAVAALSVRLTQALAAQQEAQRLQREAHACQAQADAADARVAQARATLQPLLHQAGVAELDALRQAITLSDQRRALQAVADAAQQAALAGGDGMALAALQQEVEGSHPAQAALRVQDIGHELATLRPLQDALTAEHTEAAAVLARIAGGADAARAESDRQDALAKMANATERYIQVHTASRLLKWAIDRYRETRQGPMLQRAGQIFAALTLGAFTRLSVDFDSEPLALHGQRESGPPVGVAGMSEGTRDQLYLALRLAALELQLAQGHALPFIADDLFINYDDHRAQAGLQALAELSERTQVIFLSHHAHLLPAARAVFGPGLNVVQL